MALRTPEGTGELVTVELGDFPLYNDGDARSALMHGIGGAFAERFPTSELEGVLHVSEAWLRQGRMGADGQPEIVEGGTVEEVVILAALSADGSVERFSSIPMSRADGSGHVTLGEREDNAEGTAEASLLRTFVLGYYARETVNPQ